MAHACTASDGWQQRKWEEEQAGVKRLPCAPCCRQLLRQNRGEQSKPMKQIVRQQQPPSPTWVAREGSVGRVCRRGRRPAAQQRTVQLLASNRSAGQGPQQGGAWGGKGRELSGVPNGGRRRSAQQGGRCSVPRSPVDRPASPAARASMAGRLGRCAARAVSRRGCCGRSAHAGWLSRAP